MAHAFLQSFDKNLIVRSAGTEAAGKLNAGAVKVMAEAGIDISGYTSDPVEIYLGEEWDYVITVCGDADKTCPSFTGNVGTRLHIGFDDPSHVIAPPEFSDSEFRRVRDEIRGCFYRFFQENILLSYPDRCSADTMICYCSGITLSDVRDAKLHGCRDIRQVRSYLGKNITGRCKITSPDGRCCHSRFQAVLDSI